MSLEPVEYWVYGEIMSNYHVHSDIWCATFAEKQLAKEQQLEPVEHHSAKSNRYFKGELVRWSAGIEDDHIPFLRKGWYDRLVAGKREDGTDKETALVMYKMYIVWQYGNGYFYRSLEHPSNAIGSCG